MNTVVAMHQNPRLSAALSYAAVGWHIIPIWWAKDGKCACGKPDCLSPAKHPLAAAVPWGQKNATTDPDTIKSWWSRWPEANIAAYLEPSNLVAIDIDPRNGGLQTIEDIEAKHGPINSDLLQYTGGGGEHRVFQRPANSQMPGKLGAGVDVKANGYIMLEPSNHTSGGTYQWEASSDPRDGIIASPLPDWLRDLAMQRYAPTSDSSGTYIPVPDHVRTEIDMALVAISADDRDTWLQVGMALQSTGDSNWAFETWDKWSATSNKYNQRDQLRVWKSFKAKGLDGITHKTIFHLAKANGTVIQPIMASGSPDEPPVPVDEVFIRPPEEQEPIDNVLLTPPGVLQDVVDWINATSAKPQPQFAVQAAIAFAATALGRRFSTDFGNWTPLWFLNIGLSGCGKEYAKTAVEELLSACDLQTLIGPSGYSSDAGMLSSLHAQPNHVTVIDEFHRVLEQASVKGNARAQSTLRALIEVWGRNGGVMRPTGYSTVGMSKQEVSALQERNVYNPCLTLMSMSIPSFWETIGSQAARDGFLNRFIIVQTDIGRTAGQFVPRQPVPASVVDWAKTVRAMYNSVIDPDINPIAVQPVVVPMSTGAMSMFKAFAQECVDLMDSHEEHGLAEMFSRCNENAMKLSLICALARRASKVGEQDAEWAIKYVRTYSLRTVHQLKKFMSDSPFEAAKKQVYNLIHAAGERGLTANEINRSSRKFRGMTQRLQSELLNSMASLGEIKQVTQPTDSGRGKPRQAWVALGESDE